MATVPTSVSPQRVAMKVAGLAVAEELPRGEQLTAEQVPLFLSARIIGIGLEILFRSGTGGISGTKHFKKTYGIQILGIRVDR